MSWAAPAADRAARTPIGARAALWCATAATALGALMLLTLAGNRVVGPPATSEDGSVRIGELGLRVEAAAWVDHHAGPHQAMVPDTPADGRRRLRLEMILQNFGERAQSFGPGEFRLGSAAGGSWRARGSSFAIGSLWRSQALAGDLYFDVPEGATSLFLEWRRDGRTLRVPVLDRSGSPASGHGHETKGDPT